MKKVMYLLMVCLAVVFMFGVSEAFKRTKPIGKPTNLFKIAILKLVKVQILTDSSGRWFWIATVKNIGSASANGRDYTVQGYSQDLGSNSWKPASGSIVSRGEVPPGKSVVVRNAWLRCCKTNKLKIVLFSKGHVLGKKIITGLVANSSTGLPFDVVLKKIEWNQQGKKWRAVLINRTRFTLDIGVQGYIRYKQGGSRVPAGGAGVLISPNSTASSMWLHASPNVTNGDVLEVHMWYSSKCSDDRDVNRCGFQRSYETTIPYSRNF